MSNNPSKLYLHKELTNQGFIYGIIIAMSTKKNDEVTQVTKIKKPEATQPSATTKARKSRKAVEPIVEETALAPEPEEAKAKKPRRGHWIFLGIVGMLIIVIAGGLIGYGSAIKARKAAEANQKITAAATQYLLSLQDIQNGNLTMAKTRLEYVIQIYPDYPEAAQKLTDVMVAMAQNNQGATTSSSIVATAAPPVDTSDLDNLFQTAEQQLSNQDWPNLLTTVNSIRNTDPTYKSIKVDGLYYLALRNTAITNINSGELETGIYSLTLASEIGPVDNEALGYETWAKAYLNAGAGFGVVWDRTINGLETLYSQMPYMIDVNGVTVTQRYALALKGYGDYLQSTYDWCGAVTQYEKSQSIVNLESVSSIIGDARDKCANPPATPTPEGDATATPEN